MTPPSPAKTLAIVSGLIVVTLVVYAGVFDHEFIPVWDDGKYVLDNAHVRAGLTWDGLVWAFRTTHASNWHPLTWLSHMADVQAFGMSPRGHHATNLALHLIAGVLLFTGLARLTGAPVRSGFVAALYLLHPLRVESVAWVAERKDVLSACFFMGTLLAHEAYVRRGGALRYGLVATVLALGLLAKPMLVTLPFVLLLLDVWPLGRIRVAPTLDGRRLGAAVLEKAPLLALSAASSVVTLVAQRSAMPDFMAIPLSARLTNAAVAAASYVAKTVWPACLSPLYPLEAGGPAAGRWLPALAFLLVVTAVALAAARRRPFLLVGWLFFLGTLVPVIGIVQVGAQAMADRYTLLPSIGLYVMAVWGLGDLAAAWRGHARAPRLAASVVGACVLLGLGLITRAQVREWRDGVTLFSGAVRCTDGFWARFYLAGALEVAGRTGEAIVEYRRALELEPEHSLARFNLGVALERGGDATGAAREYTRALAADAGNLPALANLARLRVRLGDPEGALALFEEAVRRAPQSTVAWFNLATMLRRSERDVEAAHAYREALRLDPGFGPAAEGLAVVLFRAGDLRGTWGALAQAERAGQRLDPRFVAELSARMARPRHE